MNVTTLTEGLLGAICSYLPQHHRVAFARTCKQFNAAHKSRLAPFSELFLNTVMLGSFNPFSSQYYKWQQHWCKSNGFLRLLHVNIHRFHAVSNAPTDLDIVTNMSHLLASLSRLVELEFSCVPFGVMRWARSAFDNSNAFLSMEHVRAVTGDGFEVPKCFRDGSWAESLSKCENLQSLRMMIYEVPTYPAYMQLLQCAVGLSSLRELVLAVPDRINNHLLAVIEKLTQLRVLRLNVDYITELSTWSSLEKLSSLTELQVSTRHYVGNCTASLVLKNWPQLRTFVLLSNDTFEHNPCVVRPWFEKAFLADSGDSVPQCLRCLRIELGGGVVHHRHLMSGFEYCAVLQKLPCVDRLPCDFSTSLCGYQSVFEPRTRSFGEEQESLKFVIEDALPSIAALDRRGREFNCSASTQESVTAIETILRQRLHEHDAKVFINISHSRTSISTHAELLSRKPLCLSEDVMYDIFQRLSVEIVVHQGPFSDSLRYGLSKRIIRDLQAEGKRLRISLRSCDGYTAFNTVIETADLMELFSKRWTGWLDLDVVFLEVKRVEDWRVLIEAFFSAWGDGTTAYLVDSHSGAESCLEQKQAESQEKTYGQTESKAKETCQEFIDAAAGAATTTTRTKSTMLTTESTLGICKSRRFQCRLSSQQYLEVKWLVDQHPSLVQFKAQHSISFTPVARFGNRVYQLRLVCFPMREPSLL